MNLFLHRFSPIKGGTVGLFVKAEAINFSLNMLVLMRRSKNFGLLLYCPKTIIPATEDNWNFTGTGWKEVEKSLDPVGNARKMMRNESSIPTGKFSDFFR
jgi:hypothetical protein